MIYLCYNLVVVYVGTEGRAVQIGHPSLIKHHNMTMDGVDRCDQNVDKYLIRVRSKK